MSLWRFRGTPHHLNQQAARLGMTQVLADRARNNQEIYRVSVLLAQLAGRYHQARKEDGKPVLYPTELAQIRGTLEQADQECSKLHALAAASAEMIDESYQAFELDRSPRPYGVACIYDSPIVVPMSNGDGTVGHDDDGAASSNGAAPDQTDQSDPTDRSDPTRHRTPTKARR